jgi:hypothetical protein
MTSCDSNVEIKGTPDNDYDYRTIYLTLYGSAGPNWNGFEPPTLSDKSRFDKDLPWSYAPLDAKTLVNAKKEASDKNDIDTKVWLINKPSDAVEYTFYKVDKQQHHDGTISVPFYSA